MKNLFIVISLLAVYSCQKQDTFEEGIYCLSEYLDKDHFESNYMETFLVKITNKEIIHYGTVKTWGTPMLRNFAEEKNQIINDSMLSLKAFIRLDKNQGTFIRLKNAEKIIDSKGINFKEFSAFLNARLIAGNYKNGNQTVTFTANGEIQNLGNLKTYSVYPRSGTNWWPDYRTIKINDSVWKFDFTKKQLVLTKYLNRSMEQAELSDRTITLKRQR